MGDFGILQTMVGALILLVGGMWKTLSDKMDKVETKLTSKIDKLDTDLSNRMEKIDEKATDIDRRLCRLEGAFSAKDCCVIKEDKHLRQAE